MAHILAWEYSYYQHTLEPLCFRFVSTILFGLYVSCVPLTSGISRFAWNYSIYFSILKELYILSQYLLVQSNGFVLRTPPSHIALLLWAYLPIFRCVTTPHRHTHLRFQTQAPASRYKHLRASNGIRTRVFDLASRRTNQLCYTCIFKGEGRDLNPHERYTRRNHNPLRLPISPPTPYLQQ